ncbi:MAG: hypothetical protein IPP51_01995 [Bacteroidetes bacterium]|nr:hypothetical protein [Bacteroidota bacterium]
MKTRGLILLFLFLFSKTEADSYNKIEIRNAFVLACIDEDKNDALIERLQNIQGNDPLIAAYVGALTAVKAKFSMIPWRKYNYCKDGLKAISESIAKSPENIEIRYLRLVIEYKTPKIAGLQGDMESDKSKIAALFSNEQDIHLKKMIASFILGNNLCSEAEKHLFSNL